MIEEVETRMDDFVAILADALSLDGLWDNYDLTSEDNVLEVITILCDHEKYNELAGKFHIACIQAGWSPSRIRDFERVACYRSKFNNREFVKHNVRKYHSQWSFNR